MPEIHNDSERLKTMQRGLLNGTHDEISSQTYGQCWNLDATENWTGMKQAEGGTDWTLEQSRTANPVNEITDITNAVGSPWAQPAYDAAGNMTTIPIGNGPSWSPMMADDWSSLATGGWGQLTVEPPALTATWDAWNRLVRLEDASTSQTVAEYQYDAENRRILKKLYASGSLSETRHIYLSDQNQILEERVDASEDAALQNIWGLQYIDGLILRDRDTNGNGTLDQRRYCLQDANWNTVALTDESGTVTQRFCYQPYGACEFLEADYDPGTNDAEWVTLFTGRELDPESGLYYFRARYLSTILATFLNRDEYEQIDGINLYAAYFAPNNVDPSGKVVVVDDVATAGISTMMVVMLVGYSILIIIDATVRPAKDPKPDPQKDPKCDSNNEDEAEKCIDDCHDQYEDDSRKCRNLKTKKERAICWESIAEDRTNCIRNCARKFPPKQAFPQQPRHGEIFMP